MRLSHGTPATDVLKLHNTPRKTLSQFAPEIGNQRFRPPRRTISKHIRAGRNNTKRRLGRRPGNPSYILLVNPSDACRQDTNGDVCLTKPTLLLGCLATFPLQQNLRRRGILNSKNGKRFYLLCSEIQTSPPADTRPSAPPSFEQSVTSYALPSTMREAQSLGPCPDGITFLDFVKTCLPFVSQTYRKNAETKF